MFPTTVWSDIHHAADSDPEALQNFANHYRPAIRAFLKHRGFRDSEADDICQDVFVRVLAGDVLAGADPAKGRFRSLMLAVTRHVVLDRHRKRREGPLPDLSHVAEETDETFDREWILHLSRLALAYLESQGSPYHAVLRDHLAGIKQDRNKLWIARRKLIARIRHEIALTCSSHDQFEEEVAYLSSYLRP
jgi:hypothetical protein